MRFSLLLFCAVCLYSQKTPPGGSTPQVQFNCNGRFCGAAGFTFDTTSGNVSIPGNLTVNGKYYGDGSQLSGLPSGGGITVPFSIYAIDPATSDPNLNNPFKFVFQVNSLNVNPTFSSSEAFSITQVNNWGQNTYWPAGQFGIGSRTTLAKQTFLPLTVSSSAVASGQRLAGAFSQTCQGEGDCFGIDVSVTSQAGMNAQGDEGQKLSRWTLREDSGIYTGTVSAVVRSSCNTTVMQPIMANKDKQVVPVASSAGCNVNDWVVIEQTSPAHFVEEPVQITAVGSNTITGIFRGNHGAGVTVKPATVLTVNNTYGFGEGRIAVDRSAVSVSAGSVSALNQAGNGMYTGSGTSWSGTMAGGDGTLSIGCIALAADAQTLSPYSSTSPLNAWWQIDAVESPTQLHIYSWAQWTINVGYSGDGPGSGAYQIKPCSQVLRVVGQNTLVMGYDIFPWRSGDVVEAAHDPNMQWGGHTGYVTIYSPSGIKYAYNEVYNYGLQPMAAAYSASGNGRYGALQNGKPAFVTGFDFSKASLSTGVAFGEVQSGNATITTATDTTATTKRPCHRFIGGNLNNVAVCADWDSGALILENNTHTLTLGPNGLSVDGQPGVTVKTCTQFTMGICTAGQ